MEEIKEEEENEDMEEEEEEEKNLVGTENIEMQDA